MNIHDPVRRAAHTPVSVVMVAYKEAGHIRQVLDEYYQDIFQHLPAGSEFIVYLDAPTDNTVEIVKNFARSKNIVVIEGTHNLGYRGAMTAGLYAAKNDVVFYSDSSGKHRASDFWNLLEYGKGFDITTGLRRFQNYSLIRRTITLCQRILTSLLFVMPFYDCNSGFKTVRKKVLSDVLDDCRYTRQSFSTELLVRAYKKGYTIQNVPVSFRERAGKNTGTNLKMLPAIIWHSFSGLVKLRLELSFGIVFEEQK